jgi:elongation factor G
VDSKEVAFVSAGKKAFLDAISKARPIILEPVVHLEVTAPEESMGDLTGKLSNKRGRIAGTDARDGEMIVSAHVPLAELIDFASELKALTGDRGSYAIELSHFEPVPANIQRQLTEAYKPHAEED